MRQPGYPFMVRVLIAAVGLGLLLAACSSGQTQEPREPVIPESTRVADSSTLAALESFDVNTGEMRFAVETQALRDLRLDDVLAGEPTGAAPHGFLRKVHAITRDGDAVVVQTSQANLTDAIHHGDLDASGTFAAGDMLVPTVHAAGVTVQAIEQPGQVMLTQRMAEGNWDEFEELSPQQSIGQGYTFRVGLDEVLLDFESAGVRVRVQVAGEIYFNAGYQAGLSIRGCWDLPPVCLTRFEASAGIEQTAKLVVSGEASAALNIEKLVATIPFSPIVLFIGPVPVVLVPSVDVYVGGSGEVRLSFRYGVTERFAALIGARWTPDRGWQDITEFGLHFDGYDEFDVNATFKASVYVRPVAKLLLYGLVGPGLSATAGVEIDAQVPRNPVWRVRGFLRGDIHLEVSLPVVGKLGSYSANLFEFGIDGRSSPNTPPEVTVRQARLRAPMRTVVRLPSNYTVRDREDGVPAVTITSSMPGDDVRFNFNATFLTPGVRTLTIVATDSQGQRVTRSFEVDIFNPPPTVFASVTAASIRQSEDPPGYLIPLTISLGATDPVDGRLDCDSIFLSVTAPDRVTRRAQTGPSGPVCEADVYFFTQGTRTMQARAVDQDGIGSSVRTYSVFVDPPPNDPPPVFDGGIRVFGEELPAGTHFRCWADNGWPFSVQASDPTGHPLTYAWTLRHWNHQAGGPVIALNRAPDGHVRFPSYTGPSVNPVPQLGLTGDAVGGPWIIGVQVSNGETAVSRSLVFSWSTSPCVN